MDENRQGLVLHAKYKTNWEVTLMYGDVVAIKANVIYPSSSAYLSSIKQQWQPRVENKHTEIIDMLFTPIYTYKPSYLFFMQQHAISNTIRH